MKKKGERVNISQIVKEAFCLWQEENELKTNNLSLNQAKNFVQYLHFGGKKYRPKYVPSLKVDFNPLSDGKYEFFKKPASGVYNLDLFIGMILNKQDYMSAVAPKN